MAPDIGYTPTHQPSYTYDLGTSNIARRFRTDPIITDAMTHLDVDAIFEEVARLSVAEDWQDRVRAEALREAAHESITLPDQFPCIYDVNSHHRIPSYRAWVVSADADMLEALLPLYQELWDAYKSQWPEKPADERMTFAVGAMDGLSPRGVYFPGTTAEEVIGKTMLVHEGMYRLAPEHLRVMHPLHSQWAVQKQL